VADRILVAYATKSGSTAEVADAIAGVLREMGWAVDVADVAQVQDLTPYGAVVLGAATRMGRLLPAAIRFAERNRTALADKTTAYFALGATMKEDTPENRRLAAATLQPLVQIKEPVSLGLFAGKVDPARLEIPWRWMVKSAKEGPMAAGDFRRWDEIRAWARSLASLLPSIR
jgi:menaquinone-dependent protoporphyrinogen oxidase